MNREHGPASPVSTLTVAACRLLIAATGLKWLLTGDEASFGVAAVALSLTFVPGRVVGDRALATAIAILLSLLLAAHVLVGMHLALYETSATYGKTVHFLGSGAITAILIVATLRYCDRRGIELPPGLCLLLALAGAVSAGTLWELLEFAVDLTGLFVAQRGLQDTMLDLLADTAGAIAVAAAYGLRHAARIWWPA